jgi:hypothetical protein
MCDPHNEDDEGIVEDFVDDAVVSGADPTQAEKLALRGAPPEWTLSKVVDRPNDPAALSLRNSCQPPPASNRPSVGLPIERRDLLDHTILHHRRELRIDRQRQRPGHGVLAVGQRARRKAEVVEARL